MRKLRSETVSKKIEADIHRDARHSQVLGGYHKRLQTDFEHGQWWVTCVNCGAQWSVVDCVGEIKGEYFDFEQVSDGDETCLA